MKLTEFKAILLKSIFILGFFCLIPDLYAQPKQSPAHPEFLYPDFILGRVKMKEGKDLILMLNYNLVTQKMIFYQKDKVFDMINYNSVDTIYINAMKFIPMGKVFYETFPGTPLTFYIQHRGNLLSPPKPAAFDGTSEISSSTYMNRIDMGSQVYTMKPQEHLRVKYFPLFWVKVNDSLVSYTGKKQFLNLFPDKKDKILDYIRKNGLKFDDRDDMIKIWSFCNMLTRET